MSQTNAETIPERCRHDLDALVGKIVRMKKYKPGSFRRRYLVFLYCVLMYVPTALAGAASMAMSAGWRDYEASPAMQSLGAGLIALAMIGIIIASFVFSSIVYRAWKQVAPFGGVPASAAVLLMYVPVVNLFWCWIASYGLSRLQLRMRRTCRMEGHAARPWIPLVWCVLLNTTILPIAIVLIDPALQDLSRYMFNGLLVLFVLWWPYVLHDTKEAAETIAKWRAELDVVLA